MHALTLRATCMHAGPGGAYIMMRPLRQRSWYRHLDVRWQTDILHILPQSTVLEIKRCAAAVLVREAASAFSGPHPLLRSYNMHASLVRTHCDAYGNITRAVDLSSTSVSASARLCLERAFLLSQEHALPVIRGYAGYACSPDNVVAARKGVANGRCHVQDGAGPAPYSRRFSSGAGMPRGELPRPRSHFGPAMIGGLLNSMTTSVVAAVTAPLTAFTASQRHHLGMSHLPPDIQVLPHHC